MTIYSYPRSQALFARASACIPAGIYGHLGPSEGCFIPVSAYPFYMSRAKDSHFWDVDGNRFIDYMCAYGPNVLGYANGEVDAAAKTQIDLGNCVTLPSPIMIELAELLTEQVASAEWAFFAKNGGDVTNMAVLTARAATGRERIIRMKGGYHGVAQWMQDVGYAGITSADLANNLEIPFNDVEALERVVAAYPGQIAGLISTPYHHPAFADSELPKEGYWKKVREICDREGIVLIIDDVRCGFRLDQKGSDYHFGFQADLICFCKALANGYNISAICGRQPFKSAASSVFYTGSYWLSAVPMAAALTTLRRLAELNGAKLMCDKGRTLTDGMKRIAAEEGYELVVTGEPSMFFMRLANDPTGARHQAFVANCVKRGVFFVNHHNLFINCSLTDEDMETTWKVVREAFQELKETEAKGDIL